MIQTSNGDLGVVGGEKYFDYFLPTTNSSSTLSRSSKMNGNLSSSTSSSRNANSDLKFKIEFYVGDFQPSDFKLKLKDNNLILEGNKKSLPNGVASSSKLKESEHFRRDIRLPDFVLIDTVSCYLETYENTPNLLIIEALINKDYDLNLNNNNLNYNSSNGSSTLRKNPINYSSDTETQVNNNNNQTFRSTKTIGLVDKNNLTSKSTHNVSSSGRKYESTYNTSINQNQRTVPKPRSSSLNSNNLRVIESTSRNGFIKYKFDLRDFDSKNINICIKNKKTLSVTASKQVADYNGVSRSQEYRHDINLPDNVELHSIKNCYDEVEGILRIDIPVPNSSSSSQLRNAQPHYHSQNFLNTNLIEPTTTNSASLQHNQNYSKSSNHLNEFPVNGTGRLHNSIDDINKLIKPSSSDNVPSRDNYPESSVKSNSNEKYLELMFNLYEFNFDNLDIYTNEKGQKVLLIKAFKACENLNNDLIKQNTKTYIRKYILPDWVSNKNINVFQETNDINNVIKNTLIVQLPIIG
jgi:HSP20 family molecular chaperone IbpA